MSIKTTQYITREHAINRIREIVLLIKDHDYQLITEKSFDPDYDVQFFVELHQEFNIKHLDKWSDRMLEDKMDEPFFRHSMFDNYLIKEGQ